MIVCASPKIEPTVLDTHMRTMVLEYLPTKLGHVFGVNVGVHLPAPWFASRSNADNAECRSKIIENLVRYGKMSSNFVKENRHFNMQIYGKSGTYHFNLCSLVRT